MDKEAADAQRHKQLCELLLSVAPNMSIPRTQDDVSVTESLGSMRISPSTFYYGPLETKSSAKMLACILMHIDSVLAKHENFRRIRMTDTVRLEFKDWCNYCSYALNCDPDSKVGLHIPENGDSDYRAAGSIAASPYKGRHAELDETHLLVLLDKRPELMNSVEWLRKSLTKAS